MRSMVKDASFAPPDGSATKIRDHLSTVGLRTRLRKVDYYDITGACTFRTFNPHQAGCCSPRPFAEAGQHLCAP